MYARMNTARWNPHTRERALQMTFEKIIPAYERHPGYGGYVLLLDNESDKGIAITLWETEADRESSLEIAKAMIGELRGVLREPPLTENFEVVVHFPGQPLDRADGTS